MRTETSTLTLLLFSKRFKITLTPSLHSHSLAHTEQSTLKPFLTFQTLAAAPHTLSHSPKMSSADPEHREEEEAPAAGDDEDTGANIAPIVKLEEVAVTTGEEDEDPILDLYVISFSHFSLYWLFDLAVCTLIGAVCTCLSLITANRNCTVLTKMGTSGRREAQEP